MPEAYDEHRDEYETITENVAYVTLRRFGLDSGARSFPYVATWAQKPEVLRGVLGTMQSVSATIIDRLEKA